MKRVKNLINYILPTLPYLAVFIFSLYQPSDPDLGWHLKYGEYFWQHGTILRDNTFSTMMPNYHWANISWLTDIIFYTAYHLGGFLGLTLLSAIVVALTLYFFAKASNLTYWEQAIVFPIVLYLEEPINVVSFRGQQLVLLFIGVLFYFISQYEKKPRMLWLTVPLFLVWASVDGEFVLGYALFGIWVLLFLLKKIVKHILANKEKMKTEKSSVPLFFEKCIDAFSSEKNEMLVLFGVMLASILVTLINPFGYSIHLDALRYIGSPLLKDIAEYLPFQYLSKEWWNQIAVSIVLFFGLFILAFRGKFWDTFPMLGGGLVLFLFSLGVRRFAWPSYYLLFPLLAMVASFLKPDGKKLTKNIATVILVLIIVIQGWQRFPFTQYSTYNWNTYCKKQFIDCSPQSAEFIITHHLNHSIFTLYGWGGWLIWNYPQIKPTVDGRMHLWEQNGYSGFIDYYSIEQNWKDIDKTTYTVAYMSPAKPVYKRLLILTKIGKWKEVYADQYAGVFVRVK